MTQPDAATLFGAMEATWPPARSFVVGPWRIREGRGGGQRVSAATAEIPPAPADVALAETAMRDLGQAPLFCVRGGDDATDALLRGHGYRVHDPVVLYTMPVKRLTDRPVPPVSAFAIWPPLAIVHDLWRQSGIGPGRWDVMARAAGPKTAILARNDDRPAGAAYVAVHGGIAMIHAIEVVPAQRRRGVGTNILRRAAHWAQQHDADVLSLAVTRANAAANALYASLGMQDVGYYHYCVK